MSQYFRPLMDFSPVKVLAYALSLILLFGISIFSLASLLVSLLFLALLLMRVMGIEGMAKEQEIIIH